MFPHLLVHARSRVTLIALLAISIVISACAPAATPMATTAPSQPGYTAPQPVRPAAAAPTAAPAQAYQPPVNQPPAATRQQPPASNQQCCPPVFPSPTPWANNDRGTPGYPFISTQFDHLSTFALDVDTASYTRVRAALNDGHLPAPEEVRVEEMINYFKMEYPDPESGAFSINLEGAPSPFGGEG